jgi:hypothetical protein
VLRNHCTHALDDGDLAHVRQTERKLEQFPAGFSGDISSDSSDKICDLRGQFVGVIPRISGTNQRQALAVWPIAGCK